MNPQNETLLYNKLQTSSYRRITLVSVTILILLSILSLGYYLFERWSISQAHNTPFEMVTLVNAFNQNDTAFAIKQTNDILARDPKNIDALIMKATALAQQGSLLFQEKTYGQQAIVIAQEVLSIDSKNADAWRIIGYANEIMQQYPQAHDAYAKSLALDPHNALTLSQEAHAYDLQGNTDRAETGYRAALTIDPTLSEAEMGLGRILTQQNKPKEALSQFLSAASTTPNVRQRAEALYSASSIDAALGNQSEALSLARQATSADSSYALGWVGLGTTLFTQAMSTSSNITTSARQAMSKESFQALLRANTLNPNQSLALYQLGVESGVLGKKAQADTILLNTLKVIPLDISLSASAKTAMYNKVQATLNIITNTATAI